ncbi:DegT/DnrJ/EryC1/StrS family aminotransferase [Enterovibrio baiacu]|uniref:DegT/DnrJ/EryC1/StrS family aminotransferase n=1 Tax=Enterovibrio baiacu TaxID=2491023 RepID=UPI003D108DF1
MGEMIPLFKVFMADTVADKVKDVLYSGFIGEGPKVVEFENELSKFVGNDKILTMNSGTAALQIAYHICLDGEKDAEIITTPITCTATNTPIITNGAKVVWADVDPITGNICPDSIEQKITPKTKAIVAVHWGGNPCDMNRINQIAKKHNIKVVEDGAHSFGTIYDGSPIGNHSDFVMHSFQAIKHLTTVDGGCLITKSKEDYERAKLLRWYGISRDVNTKEVKDLRCELDVAEAGYKAHMNDVCATVGIENLKHMDWLVSRHRENAAFYNEYFANNNNIKTVPELHNSRSAYWLYTIHVNNRDEFMEKMKNDGILVSKVHSRNDTHSMFKDSFEYLPNAEKFNETHICIPVGWWLTQEELQYIAEKVVQHAG